MKGGVGRLVVGCVESASRPPVVSSWRLWLGQSRQPGEDLDPGTKFRIGPGQRRPVDRGPVHDRPGRRLVADQDGALMTSAKRRIARETCMRTAPAEFRPNARAISGKLNPNSIRMTTACCCSAVSDSSAFS